MANGFDLAAHDYDTTFTHTPVGKMQRERVYHFLDQYIFTKKREHTLEVNCGTGEDALWLATKCNHVLATDLSLDMLQQAKSKLSDIPNIDCRQLDLNNFKALSFETPFDFIFSNFGGLNCIDPKQLKEFIHTSATKLNTKGRIALVIMPKKCLMERLYFLVKGDKKKAFRRQSKEAVSANVEGKWVNTWYYDPSDIMTYARNSFNLICAKPIGFFVPPSYLNNFFKKRLKLLSFMGWIDRRLDFFDSLSAYADHFIIILEKR